MNSKKAKTLRKLADQYSDDPVKNKAFYAWMKKNHKEL